VGIYFTTPLQGIIFYRLIIFCILILLVCWVWTFFSIRGFSIKREARGLRQEVGEVFEERFEVKNNLRFTRPWIEIRDISNLPESKGSRVISWIGPESLRSYSAYTLLSRRGLYNLGPTLLCSGDPFGLFSRVREIPCEKSLLVLPYMVEIDKFPFPSGMLPGGRAKRKKTFEVTPHAASVRDYIHGDPISRIHWASSARRDRLISKEFDQDPMADVWILLDGQKAAHYRSPDALYTSSVKKFWLNQVEFIKEARGYRLPTDTFEYAVASAASISKFAIKSGLALGFLCLGQKLMMLSPEKGERQLNKVLETLALVQPHGKQPLRVVIESQAPNFLRGSTIIIITASISDQLISIVDSLIRRNIHPLVILISPQSFGFEEISERIVGQIRVRGVPTTIISKDNDIRLELENGYY